MQENRETSIDEEQKGKELYGMKAASQMQSLSASTEHGASLEESVQTAYVDNPLATEDHVSRRARIRTLFDRIDRDRKGYIEAESIASQLDALVFSDSGDNASSSTSTNAASTSSNASEPTGAYQQSRLKAVFGSNDPPLGSTVMYARELVKVCDKTEDGRITFAEFEDFVHQKERELLRLFQSIDKGNDNAIQVNELLESVREAGISVTAEEVQNFIQHVDSDNDGVIDFFDWRDFLLLLPQEPTLKNIFHFYNTVSTVDFNSDVFTFPEDLFNDHFMFRIKYFFAGGIAGAVSRTATAPLDRLRVFLQTQTLQPHERGLSMMANAVRTIYQSGGVLSFYRGNGLNILKIFPESALKFYVFEYAKEMIVKHSPNTKDKESLGLLGRFSAGGVAGLVSQFAIYPIETLKTRLMSQISTAHHPKHAKSAHQAVVTPTIADAVQSLYRENGIRAFYRGCAPALVGIIPYAGIDLAVFETLKKAYIKHRRAAEMQSQKSTKSSSSTSLPTPVILAFGMMSGTCGAVLMYPLSLIRTRLQAQGTPGHPTHYQSTVHVIKKTYAHEGVRGFYKGLGPTLVKVLPAVSISYLVYENCKKAMGIP